MPAWHRLGVTSVLACSAAAGASDCTGTSTGQVPLSQLGQGLYLGQFQGGLYPGGFNTPPPAHAQAGAARAAGVIPLDTSGQPSPTGRYVLLSIGMSNTTQEWCSGPGTTPCDPWTFTGQALASDEVNHTGLVIANGARGGQAIPAWDDPADAEYDRVRDQVLAPMGLTEAQVQVVWVKQAIPGPGVSLPDESADAYSVLAGLGDIVRAAKIRYPNLRQAFLSSRSYAGYASTALSPEPYAYETSFAVKWLIQAQINQRAGGGIDPIAGDLSPSVAPWLGWGAYLWADGLTPRDDGLIWRCEDYQSDGTHPSQSGEEKVGALLLDFFLTSPFTTPWFRSDGGCMADLAPPFGVLNFSDVSAFLTFFGNSSPAADLAEPFGQWDFSDVVAFLGAFAAGCP